MNRLLTLKFLLFLALISCTPSDQKESRSVISITEILVDSLVKRSVREVVLYRIDCKNCKIELPAYVIWQSDGQEFIEKIQTNGQRIRIEVQPFILNYVRRMEDSLIEELISASDSTIARAENPDEGRKETLKIFLNGRIIHFPPCEYCAGDQNKFHHAVRDYITTRLFRDEIGGLFE